MKFSINSSIEILERTPSILYTLLYNIDSQWSNNNEGGETWSPYDVIGHLIHCDKYNWIPRIEVVLSNSEVRKFEPLDRFAQIELNKDKNLNQLLDEFIKIRFDCVAKFRELNLTEEQINETAIHPDLGVVHLSQLIATWVTHDLAHLSQISRIMAKQYKQEVGPWINYLRILHN